MPEFKKILEEFPEDEIVIMTDLMGGSVNSNALMLTGEKRVHVITGISLALVLGMLLSDPAAVQVLTHSSASDRFSPYR